MLWRVPRRNAWSPWAELDRAQEEMSRLFRGVERRGRHSGGGFPAVNIWVKEDDAILTAELPGVDPDEVEITVKNDTVTIRGERPAELGEGETYLRRERRDGAFERSFSLPFKVDPDTVSAQHRNGVLQIMLPRAEVDRPKRIAIKAA